MKLRSIHILLIIFAISSLVVSTCQAQQAQSSWLMHPEMHAKWKAWHESMKKTPLPSKKGCFTGAYPSTAWKRSRVLLRLPFIILLQRLALILTLSVISLVTIQLRVPVHRSLRRQDHFPSSVATCRLRIVSIPSNSMPTRL